MDYWVLILLCAVIVPFIDAGPSPPYNLQCQHNFVGLSEKQLLNLKRRHHFSTDHPNPLLSWTIRHTERRAYQKGFRVQVSKGFDLSNVVWDTGVVPEGKQQIIYQGPSLEQGELYLWNVTWWDQNGVASRSEEVGHFLSVVGFNWGNVSWIYSKLPLPVAQTFVKNIDLTGKPIEKAILYISGLGFYRAYVNGHDLHQLSEPPLFLVPGWTNYAFRVGYQVFVVTELVKENLQAVLKVSLAKGYRDKSVFKPHDESNVPDDVECVLRVQLRIEFSDGTEPMVINSDESWDVYTSKHLSTSIFDGEVYNAQVTETMVAKAGVTRGPPGLMYLPNNPNIAEIGYDSPKEIYYLQNDPSVQIVDFGVNTAGVVNISVSDIPSGQFIKIKHAEVLLHEPYGAPNGSLYIDNLRGAQQLDTYYSNGKEAFYKPVFTYHGFRYISVTNYPRKLTTEDLIRVRISTDLRQNSKLNTSIPFMNQLQENAIISHRSNLMTVPTDCDQRDERLGWMGDTGLSANAMALNFHMESYFPHRVLIIDDDVFNGSVPEITPFYRYGERPAESTWAEAYIEIVWQLFKQYGDLETAKEFRNGMYDYIMFMEQSIPTGNIANITGRNGDWCQPPEYQKITNNYPSAYSLMLNLKQLIEMLNEIHDSNRLLLLTQLLDGHISQFNEAYFSNSTRYYLDNLQISYVLPMYLDIVPSGSLLRDSSRLVNILTDSDHFHLTSGIVGTKATLPVLSKANHNNIAIEAVSSVVYPSYGYMIHNPYEPATSIWELWNSHNGSASMDSRNHHMFSSVSGWMQTDMIGFQQTKGTYGYKEMDLYPASSLDLSAASIELEYPQPVKYSWHRKGGLQCGKAAEDQSRLNPGLPKHDGLVISCGEGTISKVAFASYGNPTGVCGYHQYGECHSTKSIEVVEKQCLNHSECRVQTDGDFWGDPCPGLVEVKWLTVAVHCTTPNTHNELLNRYTSLTIDVSVPMKSTAHVNIPAYGMDNLEVWDGDKLAYASNKLLLETTTGISSASWVKERDILKLDIMSGDYSFTVKGKAPNETNTIIKYGQEARGSDAHLKCSDDRHVISRIDWASYGDPVIDKYGSPSRGEHHSHVSHMIIDSMCVGRNRCTVPMDKDLFFNGSPHQYNDHRSRLTWNLVVKFSCNYRL